MINPNPGCPNNCIFETLGSYTTTMGWTQTYDKHGNPLGKDPNIVKETIKCQTCGKRWNVESKMDGGKQLITEG